MTFHIQLNTRDDQQLHFDCASGQDLLAAATAASIMLPSQCRQGSCGACHATVTHGDYQLHAHNPDVLPAGQSGAVLMCRTTPCSDLQVALPYDHTKVLLREIPRRAARIVAIENIAENTVRLELRIDADGQGGGAAEFEPGQFMEIEIPGTDERRPYSLANLSNWEGSLEFLIRLRPHGRFSTFLRERARTGDTLTVRGAMGGFGMRDGGLDPRWFVAGGTGLAPLLSMLRRMAEFQDIQEARLFFGVNRESELFLLDELERLKAQLPQLCVDLCVSQPQAGWRGFRGSPADALRVALEQTGARPDIYVCGPPGLIRAAEAAVAESGLPPGQLEAERFVSGLAAPAAA